MKIGTKPETDYAVRWNTVVACRENLLLPVTSVFGKVQELRGKEQGGRKTEDERR